MLSSSGSFLVGLIGAGIQASRTPAMHEREAHESGLQYIYRLIDLESLRLGVEALPELLTAAERMRFDALNITFPCKQAVVPLLTDLSDDARALGAVNTVLLRDGQRIGHNTDWSGFAESFRKGLANVAMRHVVQLGAGGAGAAVAHAALTLGVERITIFDVQSERAEQLVADLIARFGADRAVAGVQLAPAMADADGLVHATPTGMAKHPGLPLPANLLRRQMWVAEIVYVPLKTELLRVAKELGCRTLDGAGMAVYQAADAFRLITGIEPNTARMRRHFESMK